MKWRLFRGALQCAPTFSRIASGFAFLFGLVLLALAPAAALAQCAPVSDRGPDPLRALARANNPLHLAFALPDKLPAPGTAELSFLGHATFLIRSPAGVSAVTDYNDYIRLNFTPVIITMNYAHLTHYSDAPDPAIKHVLRGWKERGVAEHNLIERDMRVRNVPTNIRDYGGGTRYAANSIFVFEVAGLCIAHLSHLHHTLTEEHLKQLGPIDVALVPVDGMYTMAQERAIEVIEQIKPRLVIPMHYFNEGTLGRFLGLLGDRYPVRHSESATVILSRLTLPARETLVLPGR